MNLFERIKYKLNEQPTDDNKTVNDSKVETNTNKNKKKGRYNKKQVDLTAAGRKRYYMLSVQNNLALNFMSRPWFMTIFPS